MADRNYLLRPGFQSTRGDQIITALCSLLRKMKDLEQAQVPEPERKDVGTNPDDPITISSAESNRDSEHSLIQEMRLKLLAAQIYSVTCLLQKKYPRCTRNARTNTEDAMFVSPPSTSDNTRAFDDDLDRIPVKLTRTDIPQYQNTFKTVPESDCYISRFSSTADLTPRNENQQLSGERDVLLEPAVQMTKIYTPLHRRQNESSLKKHRHFHLKLSNVPFILGTSASPSHSLTANVQNIIGTLKAHNAFCQHTPSPARPRFSTPKIRRKKECTTTILKTLDKDFSKLSIQQKVLRQQLSENKDHLEKKTIHNKYKNISDLLQTKAKEIVDCHTQIQSEKLQYAKSKEKKRPYSEPLFAPRWDLA